MKLVIVLALVLVAMTIGESQETGEKCSEACPRMYRPVCALIDGVEETFSNECLMKYKACSLKKDYIIVKEGSCDEY